MSGGTTNQSSNHNSSINFSPRITDHGSIRNGNISTGNQSGSVTGGSQGGSGKLSYSGPIPMLQMLPFSANGSASYTKGPVKVGGDVHYSRLQNLPFSANGSASYTKGPVKVGGDVHYSRLQMLPFSANASGSFTKGPVKIGGDVHYSRLI